MYLFPEVFFPDRLKIIRIVYDRYHLLVPQRGWFFVFRNGGVFFLKITANMVSDLLHPWIKQSIFFKRRYRAVYYYINLVQCVLRKIGIFQKIISITIKVVVSRMI